MALSITSINIGTTANDGTGESLRQAFADTNANFSSINNFLTGDPLFSSATVNDLSSDVVNARLVIVNEQIEIQSSTASTSIDTGSLVTNGGIGIAGNVYAGGDINAGGTIRGAIETSSLAVNGPANINGNVVVAGLAGVTQLTAGTVDVIGDVEINGKLVVHGNVSTVTTSEFKIVDPVIEIGGGALADGSPAALTSDDGKNRGIRFFYYDTAAGEERHGSFGFYRGTNNFAYRFGGNANVNPSIGDATFNTVFANVASTGSSVFNTITANTVTVSNGISGQLSTSTQPNVTALGTLQSLGVANGNVNVTSGNINLTGGTVYVDGHQVSLSSQVFTGGTVPLPTQFTSTSPSTSTGSGAVVVSGGVGIAGNLNVGGGLSVSSFSATSLAGTLTTAAQPNVTSLGTLGSLTVSGTVTSGAVSTGTVTASNAISAPSITATTGIAGTLTTAAQPNITSVGTLLSVSTSGPIIATNNNAGIELGSMTQSGTPYIDFHSSGNPNDTDVRLIASGGSTMSGLGSLSVIAGGGVTFSNLVRAAQMDADTITANGITVAGSLSAAQTTVAGLNAGSGVIQTTGNIITSTNVVGSYLYGQLKTAAQPNITSVGTLSTVSVSGASFFSSNVTVGGSILGSGDIGTNSNRFNAIYAGSMTLTGTLNAGTINGTFTGTAASITNQANSATINATSNNTANTIVLRDASGNFSAGTISAITTSARYADLAEKYTSDADYDCGTVLVFGGTKEVTTTGHQADVSVAGVVSTAPAYLMNMDAQGAVAVALRGKVPVKAVGPVRKGDLLVTSYLPGYATSVGRDASYGVAVFAKSLTEDLTEGTKIINAVII